MNDHQVGAAIWPQRRGFTLIEMLVVVVIVTMLLAMASAIPRGDEREEQVRGAAEELAAVMRETRSRAMRKNTPYGIVFNVENAPGSSGKILNNRSGGHWYRVIGPKDTLSGGANIPYTDYNFNGLPFVDMSRSSLNGSRPSAANPPPLQHYLNLVDRSWIDESHVLPKGKVRFLALTDQDNGDNDAPAQGGYYTATYPRPWFGWWDSDPASSTYQQLLAWGGYDPDLKGETQKFLNWKTMGISRVSIGGRLVSISGFHYEGWEGPQSGCVNRVDRKVLADADGNGIYSGADTTAAQLWTVARQGDPRPLINAKWLDYVMVFRPDGTVVDDWFRLRQGYWQVQSYYLGLADPNTPPFPTYDMKDGGLQDRCNGCAFMRNWDDGTISQLQKSPFQREATSYVDRTGFYWVTLATDAKDDGFKFTSAEAALRSMSPIYRVGVSPDGQVKVLRVANTYSGPRTFDASITGMDWQNKNKIWGKAGAAWDPAIPVTQPNYVNHELHYDNPDGSSRVSPVFDRVLPEMLRDRKWWWIEP